MIKDTTINIRTNSKIKEKAQNVIEANGMSLSAFINNQLLRASKTKTLTLDFDAEEPSEWLKNELRESEKDRLSSHTSPAFDNAEDAIAWLNDPNAKYENQLEKDAQSLAKMKFNDLPSEDEWVAIQPIIS